MTDDITEEDEKELETYIRQRVRLFNFSQDDGEWRDRGIGQISACYIQKLNDTYLLVNAESDGSLLLQSKIQQDTEYLKQQGRFIVWTEDVNIFGLSFQTNVGCDDVWELICQIQGKHPYILIAPENIKKEVIVKEEPKETIKEEDIKQEVAIKEEPATNDVQETFEEMLDIEHMQMSIYERDVLEQLIQLVNRLVSPAPEDKMPAPSESRLLDLFHISEDIEETEGLQQLHETMLQLLSYNKHKQ